MKKYVTLVILFTFFPLFSFFTNISLINAENYPFDGMITADSLGVHNAPNVLSNSQVTELAFGTKVKVLELQNTVYKIEYAGSVGYVAKSHVVNISTSTSTGSGYDEYCNSLKSIGFPDSYCPYLFYLHKK